jgi:hypothetical protein
VRKLLGALVVAALVACLLASQPALAVPRGRVVIYDKLEVGLDTLMEVTVAGPVEVVEGDTAKVTIMLRAVRPLYVEFLSVSLLYYGPLEYDSKWLFTEWLPFDSVKVLEGASVPAGWSTTIEREVTFSEWGDAIVEVWLGAWYTKWGERTFSQVKIHFPLTKVKPRLLIESERYKELYTSLRLNYSLLLREYELLNKSYADLWQRYEKFSAWCGTLYRNYTQLRSEYDALKRERETYTALAVAALLAAVGVAAYGWVKTVRAGKAQQRATKPAAQEAGGD